MKVADLASSIAGQKSFSLQQSRDYLPWDGQPTDRTDSGFTVHPSEQVDIGPLVHQPGMEAKILEIEADFSTYSPRSLNFSWLEDVYFCSRTQAVFDQKGRGIEETLRYKGRRREPTQLESSTEKMAPWARRMLKEDVEAIDNPIVRVGNDSLSGYGHWHLQILPAMHFVREIGLLDKVLFALPKLNSWQWESLDRFGIPRDRVKELPTGVYRCKRLLHVSPPDRFEEMLFHPRQFDVFEPYNRRERTRENEGKRIYFTRLDANRRRLDAELELIEILRSLGFESYTMGILDYSEQVELVRDATVIVGAHGSAITNMLFAPSDALVCELHTLGSLPKDHAFHMRTGAELRGQKYAAYFSPDFYRHPDTNELRWSLDPYACAKYLKQLINTHERALG